MVASFLDNLCNSVLGISQKEFPNGEWDIPRHSHPYASGVTDSYGDAAYTPSFDEEDLTEFGMLYSFRFHRDKNSDIRLIFFGE